MTKVSIIVPSHNGGKYIERCIKSLAGQTLEDIEIILIDDASTDRTLKIMENYSMIFPNIKVIHNDVNKGQGASRNIGLDVATGEYIGFVDSDDFVNPNMYKSMYEGAIKNDKPDIVNTLISFVKDDSYMYSNFNYFSNSSPRLKETSKNKAVFYSYSPSSCNKIFKKELISNYRFLENCLWEDIAFTFSMLLKSKKILEINDVNYFYRKDGSDTVSSKGYIYNPNLLDIIRVCDEVERFSLENNLFDLYEEEIRFVQISSVIARINEVMTWDIDENQKKNIISNLHSLMVSKYGGVNSVDKAILSGKVGFQAIDYLDLAEKNNDVKTIK